MQRNIAICLLIVPFTIGHSIFSKRSDSDDIWDSNAQPRQLSRSTLDTLQTLRPALMGSNAQFQKPLKMHLGSGCPVAPEDSASRFYFCPTPQKNNPKNWPCIQYEDLCNGVRDCPNGEDEVKEMCMFHTIQNDENNQIRRYLLEAEAAIRDLSKKIAGPN